MRIQLKSGLSAFVLVGLSAIIWARPVVLIQTDEIDYQNNIPATDRYWFYKNIDGTQQNPLVGGGVYNSLEQKIGRSWQIPAVVYVQGSTITIRLRLKNYYWNTITGNLEFTDFRLKVPAEPAWREGVGSHRPDITYIDLEPPDSQQVSVASGGGTTDVTISIEGLPDYVTYGDLQFKGQIHATSGYTYGYPVWQFWVDNDGWSSLGTVYLTDSDPVDLQEAPWTDLLEYTCSWAHGESGEADVRAAITLGLYWRSRWVYDPGGLYFWVEPSESNNSIQYDLTKALGHLSSVNMDCRDAAGFNVLAMNSQGHSASPARLFQYYLDPFRTNFVCGMGNDATSFAYYQQFDFNFHEVCTATYAYDAACAQWTDLAGSSWRNPPYGWSLGGYWQTSNGSGGFYGFVFGQPYSSTPTSVTMQAVPETIQNIYVQGS